MMPGVYDTSSAYTSHVRKMYGDLPLPHVVEDWKKRQNEKRPAQPVQLPLQLPLPEQEAPRHDDADKSDHGVVIIDLIESSLDDLCR